MRHFLSSMAIAAAIACAPASAVLAQNLFEPVLYINDKAITRYEVDQRMRFMQILGASGTDAAAAQEALVQDRLRVSAADQLGIAATDEGLQNGLEEFASRAGLSAAEFTAQLERAGVEPQVFRDFVKAGVVWRAVIRQRLLPQVDVTDAEVDRELTKRIETPIITRVLLSEIILPAPDGQQNAALRRAESIAASDPNEAQFAAAARQYSASQSAQAGGRLNWLDVDNLPPGLRQVVLSLQPGQMSQPLPVQGAVILFFLRDNAGTLRAGAREQVLEYMTLRMASVTDAATLAARTRSCDDLYVQAGSDLSPAIQRQTLSQNQIPGAIATQLASLDENETAVLNYGGSADLVMLCSRQPALLAQMDDEVATTALPDDGVEAAVPGAQALPDRTMVREDLLNSKVSQMADAYLQELRADAVIRRP